MIGSIQISNILNLECDSFAATSLLNPLSSPTESLDYMPEDYKKFINYFGLGTFNSYVELLSPTFDSNSRCASIATMNDGTVLRSMRTIKGVEVFICDKRSGDAYPIGNDLAASLNWMRRQGHTWPKVFFIPKRSQYMAWMSRNPKISRRWFGDKIDELGPSSSFRCDGNHIWWWQDEQILIECSGYYESASAGIEPFEFSITKNPDVSGPSEYPLNSIRKVLFGMGIS